ncbi:hypothetical protein PINS_up005021 [Pythium insidiosum]|nr:hypothetical protein PINS_up005021 [Pythium insidiosum]
MPVARAISATLFVVGIGSTIAFSTFMMAQAYFRRRFEGTAYATTFVNWFNTAFMTTLFATMIVRTTCVAAADNSPASHSRPTRTVLSALVCVFLILVAHTALTCMPTWHGDAFFHLTMISIVAVSWANTTLQDGLMRLVATLPTAATPALITGQGISGVVIAASNVAIQAATPEVKSLRASDGNPRADADTSAFLYFAATSAIVLVSTLAFVAASVSPSFRELQDLKHAVHPNPRHHGTAVRHTDDALEDADADLPLLSRTSKPATVCSVVRTIRHHVLAVSCLSFVTTALFPGVTSLVHAMDPSSGRVFRDLFVPMTFVLFNAGDFLGRWSAPKMPTPSRRWILLLAAARVLFLPLWMLCNLHGVDKARALPVLFRHDAFPAVFMLLCAFTHGLLYTQTLMRYPALLPSSQAKEIGGTVMLFALSIGLGLGAIASFGLVALLTA